MSLDDAHALCPEIDLQGIVNAVAAPTGTKVQRILVSQPEYLEKLSQILNETHQSTLQQFFIWKAVQSLGEYVESDALLPWVRFHNEIQGKVCWPSNIEFATDRVQEPDAKSDRWRTCVSHVDSGLGWILSRFFVEAAFSKKAKDLGDRIVSEIKDSFIKKLKATEWMDKEVVALAIKKVNNIRQKIGFPTSKVCSFQSR
jgi:endothelin-converting enzyme